MLLCMVVHTNCILTYIVLSQERMMGSPCICRVRHTGTVLFLVLLKQSCSSLHTFLYSLKELLVL